jgi:16S rRNA G966 N2-methylase RsmD
MRDKGIVTEIADKSIDLIFTDPPYSEESVPLYGDLAKLA